VYNTHTVHSTQFTIQNMHRTAHYLHKNERRRFDMDTARAAMRTHFTIHTPDTKIQYEHTTTLRKLTILSFKYT
jgi:hypothetical protein